MIETILSPGQYFYENDQSFNEPGPSQTGIAIVGPTEKGAAFVPTDVTSYSQFVSKFGADSTKSYVAQAAFSYLQAGETVKVTRVLGNGGWVFTPTKKLAAIVSGSTIITVLHPSQNAQPTLAGLDSTVGTGSYANFTLTISGSQVAKTVSGSLNPSDPRYLLKLIGSDASFETGSAFPYLHFANYYTGSVSSSNAITVATSSTAVTFSSSFAEGYDSGKTPWVLSDGGVRLFRFVHLGHGFKTNKDVKVAIANIITNSDSTVYTTFDVLVRAWNDTDNSPSIIEQFNGVTLNPDAPNYIANVIGDKYSQYDSTQQKVLTFGDFSNKSQYIRIEVSNGVSTGNLPANIYPNGHEALFETIAGFTGFRLPAATVVTSNTGSNAFSGFNFSNVDNLNYLNPVPTEAVTGSNAVFTKPTNDNKFILPFQGGTDGMSYSVIKKIGADIASDGTNVFGFDLSTSSTAGTSAFRKALDILSNTEQYSFDLISLPGILEQYHSAVTSYAQSTAEERTDCVYIRDLTDLNATVAQAVSVAAGVDSSYSATYFPWVQVRDLNSSRNIFVPPSVVVPQAIAYSDNVGAEWFAAAGLQRGGLGGAVDTKIRLSKAERDSLYVAKINPIVKFPTTGVIIYGQKTLQTADTALNRLNVRRLLIALKRYVKDSTRTLLFEQNTTATRNQFLNIVNPYLESVQQRQGLYAFQVVMDETLNTSVAIDRNQLVGKIYLQPTKTVEFIVLEFNIQPSSVTFS